MEINLLPQPSPVQRVRSIALLAAAGVLVLTNLWLGLSWIGASNQQRQQEQNLQEANRQLQALQAELQKKYRVETLANQYQVLMDWSNSRPDFQEEIHLLSSLLPKKSFITQVQFLEERKFALQVILPDMESVSTYLRLLEEHPKIEHILVQSVTRQERDASGEGAISYLVPVPVSERGLAARSVDGLMHAFWEKHLRPLLFTGVAYASDDGQDPVDEGSDAGRREQDSGFAGENDPDAIPSPEGGDGGGPNGQGPGGEQGDGRGGQGETHAGPPVVTYQLDLQVTMKRDS